MRELTGKPSDFLRIVLPAAARGDLDAVRLYLDVEPGWVTTIGPHNRTMLWEASRTGRLDTVKLLIDRGADVNGAGCYYRESYVDISCYCVAAGRGHPDVAEALRSAGAQIDIYADSYLGRTDRVKMRLDVDPELVKAGFRDTSDQDPQFSLTPLHYAVAGSSGDVCRFLLARGADVRPSGGLLLRWAAWRGNLEIVKLLLAAGADPAQSGLTEWATNPALAAAAAEHGFKFDINMSNWMGFPAIVDASRGNHNMPDDPSRVTTLIAKGADVNATDHKGKTALHRAAQAGFVKITQALVEAGANLNARDPSGDTPLCDALRAGRAVAARVLLEAGAASEAKNNSGRTPADIARKARRPAIRELLHLIPSASINTLKPS